MNSVEQVLSGELSGALERLAAATPEGVLAHVTAHHPDLRRRLEEAEGRLGALRVEVLERYGAWQQALGEWESLWALAALRGAEPEAADPLRSAA
jgi:hypothetical protein